MMTLIQKIEQEQLKEQPEFRSGDTLRVNAMISEGKKSRIQTFEGVCIGRKGSNDNLNASFRIRKESFGVGVERVYMLHAPNIESIQVIRKGSVRQAKIYYIRHRSSKGRRIQERHKKTTN